MNEQPVFFVFDVESVGLHGEGYAVAAGVYDAEGKVLTRPVGAYATDTPWEVRFACNPDVANGADSDREWITSNVPPIPVNAAYPEDVRSMFWEEWKHAKATHPGITMAGECIWPVEARFLSACVDDAPEARRWEGPYPLHEIASFMQAAGMDPMATYERLPDELPKHDPVGDVRQSARLLATALGKLKTRTGVL